MGMVVVNPTDRHDAISCCVGSNMGNSGFPNGEIWVPNPIDRHETCSDMLVVPT
jgi:hypothetical protein